MYGYKLIEQAPQQIKVVMDMRDMSWTWKLKWIRDAETANYVIINELGFLTFK